MWLWFDLSVAVAVLPIFSNKYVQRVFYCSLLFKVRTSSLPTHIKCYVCVSMYDSCFWWAAFLKHYTACVCVYIYAKYCCCCVLVTCFLHSWQARYLSFSFLTPFAGHQVPCPRVTQECICPIHHFIFPDPYTFPLFRRTPPFLFPFPPKEDQLNTIITNLIIAVIWTPPKNDS